MDGDGYYTARLNSPIQGAGADGLKLVLAKMWDSHDDIGVFPVLPQYDEIIVEASADRADETRSSSPDAWLRV